MTGVIYDEIRSRVDIVMAAEYYGITVRHNKALCPFHSEKTPSLSFHNNRFKCFGCGVSGDVCDLAARLMHITARQAAERLNADFSLGLELSKPPDARAVVMLDRQRRLEAAWKTLEKRLFDSMVNYAWQFLDKHNYRDGYTEYILDEWISMTDDEKREFYRQNRRWFDKIDRYIGAIS